MFPIRIYPKYLMVECYDFNKIEEKIDFSKFKHEKHVLGKVSSDVGNLTSLRYTFNNEEDFNIFLFEVELNNIKCRFIYDKC